MEGTFAVCVMMSIRHCAFRTLFRYRLMRFMFMSSLSVPNLGFTQPSCSRSTRRVWITRLPAADARFTLVLHTGFVAKDLFNIFIRYETTLSTGMSTSLFFVAVFAVSLRLTGSSANVAVRISVDYFVVNRFFKEVASGVSESFTPSRRHRWVWWLHLHLFVFRWLLCGVLLLVFIHFWHYRWEEQEGHLQQGCPMSLTWVSVVFRQLLGGFPMTSCARRFVVRFARTPLPHLF